MKVIDAITGSTSYSNKIIQVDTQKLLFYIDRANASTSAITANIMLNEKGRITHIAKDVPLKQLWEFAQTKEGFMRVTIGASQTIYTGCVDIAPDGALQLNQDKFLILELSGLQTTDTVTVYSVNAASAGDKHFVYEAGQVATGLTRSNISVMGSEYVMLQKGQLVSIVQNYSTGRNANLDVTELAIITDDMSDIAKVTLDVPNSTTYVAYGSDGYFILDTNEEGGDTTTLETTLAGSAAFNYCIVSLSK